MRAEKGRGGVVAADLWRLNKDKSIEGKSIERHRLRPGFMHGLRRALVNRLMAPAHLRARRPASFLARLLMLIVLGFAVTARPAVAQSILRDAESEVLLREMARPLIAAAGPSRAMSRSSSFISRDQRFVPAARSSIFIPA